MTPYIEKIKNRTTRKRIKDPAVSRLLQLMIKHTNETVKVINVNAENSDYLHKQVSNINDWIKWAQESK